MTLLALDENALVEIRALPDDATSSGRMHALGLFAGRRIRFIRAAPSYGPLLVEDYATGARIISARAMAQ